MSILVFTGCTSQEYSLQINDDETCNLTIQITVNHEVYSLLGTYGIDTSALNRQKKVVFDNELDDVDALFQEYAVKYSNRDFKIEAINDTIEIGFKATKKYNTISEANTDIKDLQTAGLSGLDFEITSDSSQFKTDYKVYGSVKYLLDSDIDMKNELISENFETLFDTSLLSASCSISMPASTTVSATDGTLEKGKYLWTATYDEGNTADIHIISGFKNTYMYIIAGVVVVIVIGILGFFISRYLKRRKERRNDDFYNNEEE